MKLRVGTLTVRRVQEFDRTASGVQLPRYFLSDINKTTDFTDELQHGRLITSCARDRGVYVEALAKGFMQRDWVNYCSSDYRAACAELDLSPAGRNAREALFDFLTPPQRLTAIRDRFIEITLPHPGVIEDALEDGKPMRIVSMRFRIWRGFPNGNIMFGRPQDGRYKFRACLHPLAPYPNDDIVLSQLILLQQEPDEFIAKANISRLTPDDHYDSGRDTEVVPCNRLFGPRHVPKLVTAGVG